MTYQIKAYGTLVHADTLKFQNTSKILGKKFKNLHLYHIAESHAADRPLPGESCKMSIFQNKIKGHPASSEHKTVSVLPNSNYVIIQILLFRNRFGFL